MEIGSVLSRAWQIIWKHKILWIFAILAGCTNASSGSQSGLRYQFEAPQSVQQYFREMPTGQLTLIIVGILVAVLILAALAIFLGTIGRIGLFRGVMQADQGAEKLTFADLFNGSLPYFWRVFLLNLLVGLATAFIAFIIAIIAILGTILTLGIGLVCLVPLICIFIPIGIVVGVIVEQANIAIVVENLGIMDGLKRGWEVVKLNTGAYIVMWLILTLGIGLIGGIIVSIPWAFIVIPALAGGIAGTQKALNSGLIFALVCGVIYIPFFIALNGLLSGYIQSAWTLTFMRLTSKPAAAPEPVPSPTEG